MAVGESVGARSDTQVVLTASALVNTLRQLPDGRAAIMAGATAASSGDTRSFKDTGKYVLPKDPTFAGLSGGRAYLDYSAGVVSFRKVGDRDYYLGRFVGDSAEADPACTVDLNCKDEFDYDLDLVRDPYATAPVGTQALGGFLPPARNGGALHLLLSATNEAQKADALSIDSFSKSAQAIVEILFRVPNDGATGAQDASLGIASATHATDADSIANHLFVHLDGNATAIKLQSKDGTTTVTATDSTKTYTEGSALANRVEVWFDIRDPANVKCYVNGVRVLSSTTFRLDAAANEFKLLAHLEKTASADVYEIAIDRMAARFQE